MTGRSKTFFRCELDQFETRRGVPLPTAAPQGIAAGVDTGVTQIQATIGATTGNSESYRQRGLADLNCTDSGDVGNRDWFNSPAERGGHLQ